MHNLLLTLALAICWLAGFAQPDDQFPRYYDAGCENRYQDLRELKTCSREAMYRAISEKLVYPDSATGMGTGDMAVISFLIDTTGHIHDPMIVLDPGGGMGAAALEAVKASLTQWVPGRQRGRPVRVQMNIPVRFNSRP